MRTTISTLALMSALAAAATASPAAAQDIPSDFTVSANAALVTDYRFRGVSLSGGDGAIQGGIDVAHSSGFYIGTWGSSIDGGVYGSAEVDFYGGWSGEVGSGVGIDVGILYYYYPNGTAGADVDYWEPYASISGTLGPVEAEVGVAYAWEQDSLGGDDNLYIYGDLGAGIPNTPLSVSGHLGYTDGVLAPAVLAGATDDSGFDWSLGADFAITENLSIGVAYIGVEGPSIDGFTDDTAVVTLGASF